MNILHTWSLLIPDLKDISWCTQEWRVPHPFLELTGVCSEKAQLREVALYSDWALISDWAVQTSTAPSELLITSTQITTEHTEKFCSSTPTSRFALWHTISDNPSMGHVTKLEHFLKTSGSGPYTYSIVGTVLQPPVQEAEQGFCCCWGSRIGNWATTVLLLSLLSSLISGTSVTFLIVCFRPVFLKG